MSFRTDTPPDWYWDQYNMTAIGRYLTRFEQDFINRTLNNGEKPKRLLDIATGTGRHALPLSEAGINVVGTELDPLTLKLFRRKSSNSPLVQSDAHHLPFSNGKFQCVLAIQCFEYFDYRLFLPECHRVLQNGGRLILQSLNRNNYKRAARWILHKAKGRRLWKAEEQFSCSELFKVLHEFGFQVERVRGYYWLPFCRRSDSPYVRGVERIERKFGLPRLHALSPWVILSAKKERAQSAG